MKYFTYKVFVLSVTSLRTHCIVLEHTTEIVGMSTFLADCILEQLALIVALIFSF